MSNMEIISTVAMVNGFNYDGNNLKTFQEWKKAGYTVKKGEKALIKTNLWKYKEIEKNGEKVVKCISVIANLFSIDQVTKLN